MAGYWCRRCGRKKPAASFFGRTGHPRRPVTPNCVKCHVTLKRYALDRKSRQALAAIETARRRREKAAWEAEWVN